MAHVVVFPFNPFQENTYLIYDDTGECAIFDPGCYTDMEKSMLAGFIEEKKLKPVRLINTHCHLDHIFGNKFIADKYSLALEIHEGEQAVLAHAPEVSRMYGIPMEESPAPARFIQEGELIRFGETELTAILTPGHSPASLSFFCREHHFLIAGDVLFAGSIGRTDLPGGDYDTLINSIKDKLLPLGDDITVYPGHGPETTLGEEKASNPFLQ
jgi:glyoxylase-like metal-dependent hydrolase (beta-lactamase superfamily II)